MNALSNGTARARTRCAGLVLLLLLAGCREERALNVDAQQRLVCDRAQANGLLDTAIEYCTAALTALRDAGGPPADVAGLALRLAALERQRGAFAVGLAWLEEAERMGVESPVTVGVERALLLAGQERWEEGVALLRELLPLCLALESDARVSARNAYAGYARRAELRGDQQTSAWLQAATGRLSAEGAGKLEINPDS